MRTFITSILAVLAVAVSVVLPAAAASASPPPPPAHFCINPALNPAWAHYLATHPGMHCPT